jgi:hypothetical protein
MIPKFSNYWIINEKRSPADVRLKAALTDE